MARHFTLPPPNGPAIKRRTFFAASLIYIYIVIILVLVFIIVVH